MKKHSIEMVVGIFVVIGLVCIAYMTIKLGKVSFFGNNYYTIYANFRLTAWRWDGWKT